MQQELTDEGLDVWIVGVNGIGYEAFNLAFVEGRDLAWLQDTPDEKVWNGWGVAYRDVVVLDAENDFVAVFNLTENSLATPEGYAGLKDLLVGATE